MACAPGNRSLGQLGDIGIDAIGSEHRFELTPQILTGHELRHPKGQEGDLG
jgi:hypothetical protein